MRQLLLFLIFNQHENAESRHFGNMYEWLLSENGVRCCRASSS